LETKRSSPDFSCKGATVTAVGALCWAILGRLRVVLRAVRAGKNADRERPGVRLWRTRHCRQGHLLCNLVRDSPSAVVGRARRMTPRPLRPRWAIPAQFCLERKGAAPPAALATDCYINSSYHQYSCPFHAIWASMSRKRKAWHAVRLESTETSGLQPFSATRAQRDRTPRSLCSPAQLPNPRDASSCGTAVDARAELAPRGWGPQHPCLPITGTGSWVCRAAITDRRVRSLYP
jgi:hypothetical protein